MKRICLTVLLLTLLLTGCATQKDRDFKDTYDDNSEMLEIGFCYSYDDREPTPWLATAIKANKIQESEIKFKVYVGYTKGFIDKWDDNAWNSNPGYCKFAIKRVIKDTSEKEISSCIYPLIDFENENKYSVGVKLITEGTDDVIFRDFSFCFLDEVNPNEITIEQGVILYDICLINDNNQVVVENLNCGISIGSLCFKKTDDQIKFSIYE